MQETFWGNHFYGILPENRHFHAKQLEKYQTWLIIADIWIIWTGYFHLHKFKKKSPDRLIWIVLAANATLLACFFFLFVLFFISLCQMGVAVSHGKNKKAGGVIHETPQYL